MRAVWKLVYQGKTFAEHRTEWDEAHRQMPEFLHIWARHLGLKGTRIFWAPETQPRRQMSQAGKASIRQKRLRARMDKKFPLFAKAFTREEIDRDPAYFHAETNERRRRSHEN